MKKHFFYFKNCEIFKICFISIIDNFFKDIIFERLRILLVQMPKIVTTMLQTVQ